jgi:hypothetical protein
MKKFFAILAIVALASCGGSETAPATNDSPAAEVTAPVDSPAVAPVDSPAVAPVDTPAVKN